MTVMVSQSVCHINLLSQSVFRYESANRSESVSQPDNCSLFINNSLEFTEFFTPQNLQSFSHITCLKKGIGGCPIPCGFP